MSIPSEIKDCINIFHLPFRGGDRGSYGHFLDHKRYTRTPKVNVLTEFKRSSDFMAVRFFT